LNDLKIVEPILSTNVDIESTILFSRFGRKTLFMAGYALFIIVPYLKRLKLTKMCQNMTDRPLFLPTPNHHPAETIRHIIFLQQLLFQSRRVVAYLR
jgi:hypothetical protein